MYNAKCSKNSETKRLLLGWILPIPQSYLSRVTVGTPSVNVRFRMAPFLRINYIKL
jgi:hypothetical protein